MSQKTSRLTFKNLGVKDDMGTSHMCLPKPQFNTVQC
jgi:hypothetical protein